MNMGTDERAHAVLYNFQQGHTRVDSLRAIPIQFCSIPKKIGFLFQILDEGEFSGEEEVFDYINCLKVKFSQYSSIHTNYIIPHCTTLQHNHNS